MIHRIVVGAGAAGLGAAAALADSGSVAIVDRIPVPGGTVRYDRPDVHAAVAHAKRVGVVFALGATAMRWRAGRLLICAPGEIEWHSAASLVFAGGMRPATPAELGLVGDRPAGVLPVSVARHLLEASSTLWRRVAILGDGPTAAEAAALITSGGGSVVYVGDAPEPPGWATAARHGWRATSIIGRERVTAVRIERDGDGDLLACDAVLLAAESRPVRNVDGAITEDADGVLYLQDIYASSFEETARIAGTLAQRALCARPRMAA